VGHKSEKQFLNHGDTAITATNTMLLGFAVIAMSPWLTLGLYDLRK